MNINRKDYIEKFIKIVDKNNNLIDLKFNFAQQKLYDTIKELKENNKPIRIIILKARQLGLSTATESIFFTNSVLGFNINSLFLLFLSLKLLTLPRLLTW